MTTTWRRCLPPGKDDNMADPVIQAGAEMLSGAPIPFRFEVTWNSLTRDLTPGALGTIAPPRPKPLRNADAREWEMVLPRMRRPTALAPPAPKQLQPAVEAPQFMIASDPV